jgi:hypothetical protein
MDLALISITVAAFRRYLGTRDCCTNVRGRGRTPAESPPRGVAPCYWAEYGGKSSQIRAQASRETPRPPLKCERGVSGPPAFAESAWSDGSEGAAAVSWRRAHELGRQGVLSYACEKLVCRGRSSPHPLLFLRPRARGARALS